MSNFNFDFLKGVEFQSHTCVPITISAMRQHCCSEAVLEVKERQHYSDRMCTMAKKNDHKRSMLMTYACKRQSVHVEQGKESPWGVPLGAQCLLPASIID